MNRSVLFAVVCWLGLVPGLPAAGLTALQTGERINVLLAKELSALAPSEGPKSARANDEVFLRRVSLDLVGRNPTPKEITDFLADGNATKRALAVDRLLASPDFGKNWGRYWRDAILSRRTEPRAEVVGPTFVEYLAKHFNEDDGWDRVAREMITASGNVRENGATAIIMAQSGNAEEVAAEVSRLFLGVQIQCAQCHDHPTDRWKRQQFHELAAFFARVETRLVRGSDVRFDFRVIGRDRGPVYAPPTPNGKNRSLEHFMPDMNDPKAQGTIVQPVLFLTNQRLDTGKTDALRRDVLAAWTTDAKNPWFAKAFVNRVWTELVGWGFYEPIDDLGPDRECRAPKTLEFLAAQFAAHDCQVKWLYRTIMSSDAYQRAPGDPKSPVYIVSKASRLRSDQLYDNVTAALGVDELYFDLTPRQGPLANLRGPRHVLAEEFGFDPSEPRDDQAGSIPQALLLMNSKAVQRGISAGDAKTALGKLLATTPDDSLAIERLYLRTLARHPSDQELRTCLEHLKATDDRGEAFEDLQWGLLNSAEMLHRR